ncbi:MAG TPA: CGNR zinc finger domain-containing protein [Actinomycetota bacterium]|nr:CGNR zinc finger domain-containing protein [Actinomycetota bacterium]
MTVKADTVPAPTRLVAAFVNTLDLESPADRIGTPAALRAWLQEQSLLPEDAPLPGRYDVDMAQAMREDLRDLLECNCGGPLAERCVNGINRVSSAGRLVVRIGPDGRAVLEPETAGVSGALGAIMAAVYTAMTDGTWERLKTCRRESCRWVFYDASKNRSGQWCSMKVCGNREKARQYRERHKA